MQWKCVDATDYLGNRIGTKLIDVRSEREFAKGHIPGAINIPLLSDTDRHEIGIKYKQEGRNAAVLLGFERVGPEFHRLIHQVQQAAGSDEIYLYCWRGGMRSNIMAWMLSLAGMRVFLLQGGYKKFRNFLTSQFQRPKKLIVLGGKTGSGKTEVLVSLMRMGVQALDLEGLASHKGSAFGHLGMKAQPSQEQFENFIGFHLYDLNPHLPLLVENESRMIGHLYIPEPFFTAMRSADVIEIDVERSERIERLYSEYCGFPGDLLKENTLRVQKRLGPQNTRQAIDFLDSDNRSSWLDLMLQYYDKTYDHSRADRNPDTIKSISFSWAKKEDSIRLLYESLI
ncbi:MAG: tRNA 2-selenouridine(34) synthase MnmH [Bacteroidota bacterium]|jgi:tRNA 2-selenouridine synthase